MPTLDVFLAQACNDRAVYVVPGDDDGTAGRLHTRSIRRRRWSARQTAQPVRHWRPQALGLRSFPDFSLFEFVVMGLFKLLPPITTPPPSTLTLRAAPPSPPGLAKYFTTAQT